MSEHLKGKGSHQKVMWAGVCCGAGGLGAGAIVAIVLAVLAAVAGGAYVAYRWRLRGLMQVRPCSPLLVSAGVVRMMRCVEMPARGCAGVVGWLIGWLGRWVGGCMLVGLILPLGRDGATADELVKQGGRHARRGVPGTAAAVEQRYLCVAEPP